MSDSQRIAAQAVMCGIADEALAGDLSLGEDIAMCFGVALFLRGGLGIDAEVVKRDDYWRWQMAGGGLRRCAVRMDGQCTCLDGHAEADSGAWEGVAYISAHGAVIQRFALLAATVYQAWLLDSGGPGTLRQRRRG